MAVHDTMLQSLADWVEAITGLPTDNVIITNKDEAAQITPPASGDYVHVNISQGPKLLGTPRKTREAGVWKFSQGAEYVVTFGAYRAGAADLIATIMLLQDTAPAPFDLEFLTSALELPTFDQTSYESHWSAQARVYVRIETSVPTTAPVVSGITVDVTTT